MVLIWILLPLLAALASARSSKRQKSQLFLNVVGKRANAASIPQCDELELSFGGGIPPYAFTVWSDDQHYSISEVSMDAEGSAIWSFQANPVKVSLHLSDSTGSSVGSQSFRVLYGSVKCFGSTPVIRMGSLGSKSAPDTSSTAAPRGSLADCRDKGPARCRFTASGESGIFLQQALIGNVFANCYSNKSVKQTFSGSTTITDNWSIQAGPQFGTILNSISVTAQVSHGEARTVTQTFEWDVDPGQQTALVAVGRFNGLYGGMDLSYSNGSSVRLENAVYFQSTGEKATVTRLDIGCTEEWPSWNATTENGAVSMHGYGSYGPGALALLLLIWTLP